jgi:hypothetical protein
LNDLEKVIKIYKNNNMKLLLRNQIRIWKKTHQRTC